LPLLLLILAVIAGVMALLVATVQKVVAGDAQS
jgi:hypothetical protein